MSCSATHHQRVCDPFKHRSCVLEPKQQNLSILSRRHFLTSVSVSFQLSSILSNKMLKPSSYHEAKQVASEYHEAKQALIKAFHKAGLGAWVKKPIEQDQFTLSS